MASRSEKLRRRQHRREKRHKWAKGRALEHWRHGRPENVLVIDTPPGAEKMSEVLWALVEWEAEVCKDDEALKKLLTFGMAAWNASLAQGAERTGLLEDLRQTMPAEMRVGFDEIMEALIRRKETLFPHNQRPILSFELTPLPSGEPYLSVMYGLA